MIIKRIFAILLLCITPSMLHAQNIIGKQINDAILTLGLNYTRVDDGQLIKVTYSVKTVDHPGIGVFKEYNRYDFLNGVCEARHIYMPKAYEQSYIDYFNKKYGWKADNLWREENDYHITIKGHDNDFELMVWTPAYEAMLDSKY